MSTFEGPMMSIKTVNALSHYTDWTIGHVHSGALGWVAMITIGSMYYLLPRLYGNREEMYSTKADRSHFWIATMGMCAVHRFDVDCRCDAGLDVACHQPGRHVDLLVR
jgi:cytochrome c oxidase cbb3-type subunit 1